MRPRSTGYRWYWLVVVGVLLSLGGASFVPGLSTPVLGQSTTGATLSVLAPPVEVAHAGTAFATAQDGMAVGPGDRYAQRAAVSRC